MGGPACSRGLPNPAASLSEGVAGLRRWHLAALIVLLFGLVSLLGDASYEGLRSILPVEAGGPGELGGLVGVGEFIAYGLRGVAGLAADLLGSYWAPVFIGYGLVPLGVLLALYGGPAGLALGYWLERLGKAIRGPSRDALLSSAAPEGRRGLVFGVHEALDQLGAVVGPLLAYLVVKGRAPAWLLAAPGAATLAVLLAARHVYARASLVPTKRKGREAVRESLRASMAAVALVAILGLLTPNPLAVAAVAKLGGEAAAALPLLYAAAMASDALAAVPLGLAYDRSPKAGIVALAASGAAAAAALLGGHWIAAALLSGIVEAGYETVARAMARGATGYGALGVARGLAAGGSILLYAALYSHTLGP